MITISLKIVYTILSLSFDYTKTVPLNIAYFIGKRIAFNKQKSFSRFIIRLSIAATALSVAAMIITLAFVNGFQKTVSEKVFSFWGHIRVQHYEGIKSLVSEETAITKNDTIVAFLKSNNAVKHVQTFATKSAVIENSKEIEGILFKGVEQNCDSNNLKQFIQKGRWLHFNDTMYAKEILVPQKIAEELSIQLNAIVNVHFVSLADGSSTYRPVKVVGIFKTGIEEYDKQFVLGDLKLIQKLSNWQPNEIGGYEVFLKNYKNMTAVNDKLELPTIWASRTIKQIQPTIFDWLSIQDNNRDVIFTIMALVAIINLATCLLILVLERTKMIGTLKAIGATDYSIQKTFLYYATFIAITGIGIGFLVGVGLCFLQQFTGFIKLDEASYYLTTAPIHIVWWQVLAVCISAAIVCFLALIIPTLLVKTIKPLKAIQFK